ncbi:hypothetical protein COH21_007528 [Aspergillus flavus]|nr:hypothetical protein COH21_007528 [Aspergillus flavus]
MPPRYPQLPQNLTTTTLTQALTAYLLPSTQTQPNLLNDLSTCLPTYPPKTTVQFYLTHRLTSLALNCLLYPFERYTSFLEDQDFDLSLLSDSGEAVKEGDKGGEEGEGGRKKEKKKVHWVSIEMNIGDFEHLMSQALLNLLNNVAQDAVGSELDRDVRGLIDSAMEWFVGFD